jgi:hypothetical protein
MSKNLRKLMVFAGVVMLFAFSGCALLGERAQALVSTVSDIADEAVTEIVPTEEPTPDTEVWADPDDDTAEEPGESESAAIIDPITDEETNRIEGLCVHPYFPVIEGQVWQYQSYDEGNNIDTAEIFEISYTDIEGDQFTSLYRYFDPSGTEDLVLISSTWECTEDGLLQVEYPAFQFGDAYESINIDYETIEVSGITFPQPEQFVVGSSWDLEYVVTMLTTIEDVGTYFSTTVFKQNTEVMGFETVEVPAGIFEDAVRLESRVEMEVTAEVEGNTITIPTTFTFTSWYAKGVGLLLSLTEADLGSSVTELVSIQTAE